MSVSIIPSHLSEVSERIVPINSVHFLQTKKQTNKKGMYHNNKKNP